MLKTENAHELLQRLARYREDPWAFLSECVYTLDQTDKLSPKKRFPTHFTYLYVYTRCWEKYYKIAVPKSRRMFMSWCNIALYLWDTMFHNGRFNAFVSRKEEAADELVRRAKFIYENIPEDMIPRELLPKAHYKFCNLIFPETNSQIQGFPQGADQLRQFTFSGILGDEMAFWENAQAMYASSMPTLEGGGRFTGISSPGPGFFKNLVFDNLELDGEGSVANENKKIGASSEEAAPNRFPMEGVEAWINPKNGFLVFQLHYSANPDKRDEKYRDSIRTSMPRAQYLQEYELQWESFSGMPVYPDFQEKTHGAKKRLSPENGLPLLRGWDFGLTPACVVAQLQGDRLVILWEMAEKNMGAKRFVPKALAALKIAFPEWSDQKKDWLDYSDPSGAFRKDTDEGTCFGIMVDNGLKPRPGAISWEHRKGSVEHFLLRSSRQGPGLEIDMERCPVLTRGFKGGYRYPEKAEDIEPDKIRPIKDEHSHPHDALQMITSSIVKLEKKKKVNVPSPSYSWTGPNVKVEVTSA